MPTPCLSVFADSWCCVQGPQVAARTGLYFKLEENTLEFVCTQEIRHDYVSARRLEESGALLSDRWDSDNARAALRMQGLVSVQYVHLNMDQSGTHGLCMSDLFI